MSEEKKLSTDKLKEVFIRMFARWGGLVGEERQAYEQLKSLIESSAQEPSEAEIRGWIEEKHVEWVDGYWKLPSRVGVGLSEYTKNFIRSLVEERVVADWIQGEPYEAPKPSEAEIEEFVERQIKGFKLLYLNCDDLFSRFLNNLQSWRLKKLLKEYDFLLERRRR